MKAFGKLMLMVMLCPVTPSLARSEPITYTKHIAPIIYQHCLNCHREGEIAPFALENYQQLRAHAAAIKVAVNAGYMPPWKAEPLLDASGHDNLLGDRKLSDEEIRELNAWIESGMPEGSAADLPPKPQFSTDWQLGKPDLVLEMPRSYMVRADGPDIFRCFVIPTSLPSDVYIRAVEFKPGNKRVVHHAIFFLDLTGSARALDAKDTAEGYASFGGPGFVPVGNLGGWVPGASPRQLPEGTAYLLRKGVDIVIQTHFHPTGKPESERSTIALYFAKEPPKEKLMTIAMSSRKIDIEPGDTSFVLRDSFELPSAVHAIAIQPHAHFLGKYMHIWAALPDGTTKQLLTIDDWDFNWQDQYTYRTPIALPKGTMLQMLYTYDNSAGNPRNPSSPPKEVKFGQQSTEEMGITFINFISDSKSDLGLLQRKIIGKMIASNARNSFVGGIATLFWNNAMNKLIDKFDVDHNGYLDEEEWEDAIAYLQWKRQHKD